MSQPLPCDGTGRALLAVLADDHRDDATIARWARVDRSLVGHWRSGARSMPAWAVRRVLRCVPMGVGASALRELAPEGVVVLVSDDDGSPRAGDLLASVVAASGLSAALLQRAHAALADGRLTDAERREIESVLDQIDRVSREVRAALRGAR